jgi:hypothetical protein
MRDDAAAEAKARRLRLIVTSVDWGRAPSCAAITVWRCGLDGRYRIVDSYTIGGADTRSVPACQRVRG